jgi:hypothetical protein
MLWCLSDYLTGCCIAEGEGQPVHQFGKKYQLTTVLPIWFCRLAGELLTRFIAEILVRQIAATLFVGMGLLKWLERLLTGQSALTRDLGFALLYPSQSMVSVWSQSLWKTQKTEKSNLHEGIRVLDILAICVVECYPK